MNSPDPTRQRPSATALVPMLVLTVLNAVALFPVLIVAPFSLMAFDAPGSERNPLAWMMFLGVMAVPGGAILALGLAWAAFVQKRKRLALGLNLVASAVLLAGYLAFFIVSAMD